MVAPGHLAVIPDGNRRWARARGMGPADGHAAGIGNVGRIADAALRRGVTTFTFWWGSPANLTKRDPREVEAIERVLGDWLDGPARPLLARHGAGFEALGRWEELCPRIAPAIRAATEVPATSGRRVVLLMAYDGREELLAAADAPDRPRGDLGALASRLWTGHLPPVDLVVRTGGEPHLSAGFLLWQIAEAQLVFSPTMWPAYTPAALGRALDRYAKTERRHGR